MVSKEETERILNLLSQKDTVAEKYGNVFVVFPRYQAKRSIIGLLKNSKLASKSAVQLVREERKTWR